MCYLNVFWSEQRSFTVAVSKSFIFLVKSFWATLIDIWRFLSGHTAGVSKNRPTILQNKNYTVSKIWTRIVGLEGENTDSHVQPLLMYSHQLKYQVWTRTGS